MPLFLIYTLIPFFCFFYLAFLYIKKIEKVSYYYFYFKNTLNLINLFLFLKYKNKIKIVIFFKKFFKKIYPSPMFYITFRARLILHFR